MWEILGTRGDTDVNTLKDISPGIRKPNNGQGEGCIHLYIRTSVQSRILQIVKVFLILIYKAGLQSLQSSLS